MSSSMTDIQDNEGVELDGLLDAEIDIGPDTGIDTDAATRLKGLEGEP